jgi:hypothetical protein
MIVAAYPGTFSTGHIVVTAAVTAAFALAAAV